MNLAERYTEQERIDAINEWMKSVSEITSETVSLAVEGDPLTNWDKEYYTIVRYKDGSTKRDLSSREQPSKMYKHVDSIMKTWGLELQRVSIDPKDFMNSWLSWKGTVHISMTINKFHTNMFTFEIGSYNWKTYDQNTIESVIEDYMIEIAEKTKDLTLQREIKLKALTK